MNMMVARGIFIVPAGMEIHGVLASIIRSEFEQGAV
jgi:hypothetical protein